MWETAPLPQLKELTNQIEKYGNARKLYGQLTGEFDLWIEAYTNTYSNKGSMTPGVIKDIVDGKGKEKMRKIMNALKYERYQPKPVKRVYIKKKNSNKKRPLGLPVYTDKLIQEVMRMQLQAIYEPLFKNCSHGFRPNRSCHTALRYIQGTFTGTRWWIEGDIRGCFDNIEHGILSDLLNKRIDDNRFIQLVEKFLKAGYVEDWRYNRTLSGVPQGGILSPILANIYLHELDKFILKLNKNFEVKPRKNPEYSRIYYKMAKLRQKIKWSRNRKDIKAEIDELQDEIARTPNKMRKKIKYCRYADDFIVGVIGSKSDAEEIRQKIANFLKEELNLELSIEKTKITKHTKMPEFLSYELAVIPYNDSNGARRGNIVLRMPKDKIKEYKRKFTKNSRAIHIPSLRNFDDLSIIDYYNYRLRGWHQYWKLACNVSRGMNKIYWVARGSFFKTMANKYKSTMEKMADKYYDRLNKEVMVEYRDRNGNKKCRKMPNSFKQQNNPREDWFIDSKLNIYYFPDGIELKRRLAGNECELCGRKTKNLEAHHIKRMADVKNQKSDWEILMHKMYRKTLIVCKPCHKKIHYDWIG